MSAARMRIQHFDHLPAELSALSPREVTRVFPTPALISIAGERPEPLFLSTLLHGNETTSFFVLQALARKYGSARPPRSLMIFVGNVEAAAAGERFLPGQPDFNRIWKGDGHRAHDVAQEVIEAALAAEPFASIDIHNNTGENPFYGCVASLRPADLSLAALFSPLCVLYRNPDTTQSVAFSQFCPALTVECGRSGDEAGVARAIALVEGALALDRFPDHAPPHGALRLYQTLGRVVIDAARSIAFGEADADLVLRPDIEATNFTALPAGAHWARFRGDVPPLRVLNEHGDDLTGQFLRVEGKSISLARALTPSMATRNERAIRDDCLCYFMSTLSV